MLHIDDEVAARMAYQAFILHSVILLSDTLNLTNFNIALHGLSKVLQLSQKLTSSQNYFSDYDGNTLFSTQQHL